MDLTETQLQGQRLQLKHLARKVSVIIEQDLPNASKWSDLQANDQLYYALMLEGMAAAANINIFLCKRQWCAKDLLRESFKAKNQTNKRRMERKGDSTSVDKVYIFIMHNLDIILFNIFWL